MHLYIITRGIKKAVDDFITQLQGKYVPCTTKGSGKKGILQVGVRPIQLWEIVFPEASKNIMLNTCLIDLETQHKKHKKWVAVIRRILGAKKISKEEFEEAKKGQYMPINKEDVEIVPIGIKEDEKTQEYI